MQLDSSIDQRMKELEDVNREIQQHRDVSDQEEQMTQHNYYELLASKMDKSKALYETVALQQQAQAYNDISTNRFRSQFGAQPDQIQGALQQARVDTERIENVLTNIRNENPDLDVILSKLIGW